MHKKDRYLSVDLRDRQRLMSRTVAQQAVGVSIGSSSSGASSDCRVPRARRCVNSGETASTMLRCMIEGSICGRQRGRGAWSMELKRVMCCTCTEDEEDMTPPDCIIFLCFACRKRGSVYCMQVCNVKGVVKKQAESLAHLSRHDFICLTETWLAADDRPDIHHHYLLQFSSPQKSMTKLPIFSTSTCRGSPEGRPHLSVCSNLTRR